MNHSRPRRRALLPATLLPAAALFFASGALPAAADGHLRIISPVDGILHLRHASGWERWAPVTSGSTLIWNLPTGEYAARFESPVAVAPAPAAPNAAHASAEGLIGGALSVWDGITSAIEIDPTSGILTQLAQPEDAGGAILLIDGSLLQALPGEKEAVLGALDTHQRWRPGARIDGADLLVATERREILPAHRSTLGPSWIALSALPAGAGSSWNLSTSVFLRPEETDWGTLGAVSDGSADTPWLRLQGGARQNTFDGTQYVGDLRLTRSPFGLVGLRGMASLRYADLTDASPRARADGTLPHNDARSLDLIGRFELGPPAPGAIAAGAAQDRGVLGGGWGLNLQLASRGWQRNHFLEVYRYNAEHAPYEETALFDAQATFHWRLGERTRGELRAGYSRYLTRLNDGLYKGNLERYGTAEFNGGTDETGVYWSDGQGPDLTPPHVFDYSQRKFTESQTGGIALTHAPHPGAWMLRAAVDATLYHYRRFEHFAPTDIWAPGVGYTSALSIGYDEKGEERADNPHPPGEPLAVRTGLLAKIGSSGPWRFDATIGGLLFSARDSALVSLQDPFGENGLLDPTELRETSAHFQLEGSFAARRAMGDVAVWGIGYRRAYEPPLEALYSPRAHLELGPYDAAPEGVMGNPDLGPETETGAEFGIALPLVVGSRPARLTAAVYAARMGDAVAMTYSRIPREETSADTLLPTYENSGSARRWGLHLDATIGHGRSPLWVRLACDIGRIECDYFEPPLLDSRWLYPDLPQDEYASEGYAGPLGGILDGAFGAGGARLMANGYRPANLDRTVQFSLALVARDRAPAHHADWFTRLTRGWTLGALARIETGRPFTQTILHAAAIPPDAIAENRGYGQDDAWEEPAGDREPNGQRMPGSFLLDLALTRRFPFGSRHATLAIEALNLLNVANALAVYRATGKPDDDGCLQSPDCSNRSQEAGASFSAYNDRLIDPRHYERPLILQVALTLEII